jgi:hypothetical protein
MSPENVLAGEIRSVLILFQLLLRKDGLSVSHGSSDMTQAVTKQSQKWNKIITPYMPTFHC